MRRHPRLQKSPAQRQQRGNALVFALMALAITGIAVSSTIEQKRFEQKQAVGNGEATVLTNLSNATNKLIFENFNLLRNGLPVTKGGVTVSPVVVSGAPVWRPTIAELRTMGYLPAGWTSTTSTLNDAAYQIEFRRVCVSAACDVDGQIVISGPVRQDNQVGTVDGPLIGPILEKLGADAGVSLIGTSNTITGFSNTWTVANPVSGTPPGVVAVRVGSIASAYADFLRVGDGRDPNFSGNLTVAGNTTLNGTVTVAGLTMINNDMSASGAVRSRTAVAARDAAGCDRAELLIDGRVQSRDAGCTVRAGLQPDGSVVANNAAGSTRAFMQGTGEVGVNNGAGTNVAALDGTSGRVWGSLLQARTTATAGNSCATNQPGDIARDASSTGTILVCQSGPPQVWRRAGLMTASEGGNCAAVGEGVMAADSSERSLICRSNRWRFLNDRVSAVVVRAVLSGNGQQTIGVPSCGSGGIPEISVAPVHTGADYGGEPPRNRFELRVAGAGSGWTVTPVLVDGNGGTHQASFTGVPYQFGWIATTYCNYGAG